jgi:hypothetical protein
LVSELKQVNGRIVELVLRGYWLVHLQLVPNQSLTVVQLNSADFVVTVQEEFKRMKAKLFGNRTGTDNSVTDEY